MEFERDTPPEPNCSGRPRSSRKLLKTLVLLCVVGMLVPIIPFAVAGPYLEELLAGFIAKLSSPEVVLAVAFCMLASDIFLPVPSSAIITFVGVKAGFIPAVLSTAAGLTVGCVIGYELARRYGALLLSRLADPDDISRLQARAQRAGGMIVVLTRPLPILGETAVLIVGCLGLPRQVFYTAVSASNLAVAIVYVQFGRMSREQDSLIIPLVVSLLAPLLLTFVVRKILQKRGHHSSCETTPDRG